MLRNLMAEMARNGLHNKDLASVINKDEKTVSNKILCRTEFTRKEMLLIRKKLFPSCTLDYLFDSTA